MSRSYKKTPINGHTCFESEKQDKRRANRKFRRATRYCLRLGKTPPFSLRQVSNIYDFAKDGKSYFCKARWPELMRK
ncbi:hypothetical protein HPC37_05875 [Pasteurellaceae bacterium 20609_3]|uniref:hypothetical protein n=1 Tax=Spirabiliibacterium mucosae TaxID=28156 RepID=UPI001AAC8B5F|nr:hypothetical protein [Spirabiliibacterium mucosae]MBE2898348.1 hypothetical protein [Spirabiliibacterium mucosae]